MFFAATLRFTSFGPLFLGPRFFLGWPDLELVPFDGGGANLLTEVVPRTPTRCLVHSGTPRGVVTAPRKRALVTKGPVAVSVSALASAFGKTTWYLVVILLAGVAVVLVALGQFKFMKFLSSSRLHSVLVQSSRTWQTSNLQHVFNSRNFWGQQGQQLYTSKDFSPLRGDRWADMRRMARWQDLESVCPIPAFSSIKVNQKVDIWHSWKIQVYILCSI